MSERAHHDDLRDQVERLQETLSHEREQAAQWRRVAEERRVALERLQRHPAVRIVLVLARVLLPPARRLRWRARRLRQHAREARSALSAIAARLTAPRRARRLRQRLEMLSPVVAERRTVTVVILTRDGHERLERLLPALRTTVCDERVEVVVVDNASSADTRAYLAQRSDVRVLRNDENLSFAAANNRAAETAAGEVLCFLNDDVEPLTTGWLSRMLRHLDDDVVAVGAQLVYPRRSLLSSRTRDLGVQHLGIEFDPVPGGVPRAVNAAAGVDPDPTLPPREVAAATAACLVVERAAFERIGGFDEGYWYGTEDVDLCWRLRRDGGRIKVAPDAVLFHHEGATRHREPVEARQRRQEANWGRFAASHGPAVTRAVALDRLEGRRVLSRTPFTAAITVTRDDPEAGYGDWHTGHELREALSELGWDVTLVERHRDRWYRLPPGLDLLIVLLDAYDVRRAADSGATTVAWVRNWTERWLAQPWFDDYDLVLASSQRSCDLIREASAHRPHLFPLATNPQRFTRGDADRRGVVFPGNYWGEDRGLGALVASVPELEVYGHGWGKVAGTAERCRGPLAYEELPVLYQRAEVVVDQAASHALPYGSVNSRVFDALASGALVVTNNTAGSDELFDSELPVYASPDDLRRLIDEVRHDPSSARDRAALLRKRVLMEHTYAVRARRLRDLVSERVRRPSFVLQTSAPDRSVAATWGDWHLAAGLARSLRGLGCRTAVQLAAEWEDPAGCAYDVAMHLKGRSRVTRRPGQVHIIWNISHPEELTPEECDDADLVLVASERFAAALRSRTSTAVDVLLQATDHRRFRPHPPDPRFRHEVAFVGNSRMVRRRVIDDALHAGLRPAIFGANWERFVPPELVQATFIPNEELPRVYSSVTVLLNDHWEDMRRHGFVSNRLFDALACAATVVSDELPELRELFDDAVATYRTAEDLRDLVEALLADPDRRDRMGRAGRAAVLTGHTFDHRASQLLAAVTALLPAGEVAT